MWHTHQLIWVLHGCHCKSGLPLPIVLLFPGRREPAIRLERNAVRPTADRVKTCVMTPDPYAVLGLTPKATQAEITHAYRRQLRDHHPDLHSSEPDAPADEQLRRILAAYALLRNPTRRAAYDRAHPSRPDAGPTRIAVNHVKPTGEQPDLRAGPVRWHR